MPWGEAASVLTPHDIVEIEFDRAFRGYSVEQVDAFMRKLVGEYETLYQQHDERGEEIERLKAQVQALQAELAEFRRKEGLVDETVQLAREAAAQTKKAATREADAIIRETHVQAEQMLAQARREVERERLRAAWLRKEGEYLRERLRQLLEGCLALLDAAGDDPLELPEDDPRYEAVRQAAASRSEDEEASEWNEEGPIPYSGSEMEEQSLAEEASDSPIQEAENQWPAGDDDLSSAPPSAYEWAAAEEDDSQDAPR